MAKLINPETLSKSGTEHGEQTAFFCLVNMVRWQGWFAAWDMEAYGARRYEITQPHPSLRWIHACPNGGGRGMQQGLAFKAEGVKGGVADISWPMQCGPFTGLYIEMKRLDGVPSDVSAEQYDFGQFVTGQGKLWEVCFGWRQAAMLLQAYMNNEVMNYQRSPHQQTVHDKMMELYNAS